jgi:hypothetical protein
MSFVHADIVPGFKRSVTDLDHRADPDPEFHASANGPVRVCLICGERVKPAPQRTDITGGILRFFPTAVVEARQYDGGVFYEARFPDGKFRTVRLGVDWGDDEAHALAVILDRIKEGERK